MALDINCKLAKKLPVKSGQSARGAWCKQEFIVETLDQFPKKICMSVWGENGVADLEKFREGETIEVSINIESREYNGNWYTDVRAWRISKAQSGAKPEPQPIEPTPVSNVPQDSGDGEDDLPF